MADASTTSGPRVAQYQGTIQVPLRTLTNTLVPSAPNWSFGYSPWPVEWSAYLNGAGGTMKAICGNVFDLKNIATSFNIGDKSGGFRNDSQNNVIYNLGQLRGFNWNGGTISNQKPNTFNYGFTLGNALTVPNFSCVEWTAFNSGGTPGSQIFDGVGCQLGAGDIVWSSQQQAPIITTKLALYMDKTNNVGLSGFQFPDQSLFGISFNQICVSPLGENWVKLGGSGSAGRNLGRCNLLGNTVDYISLTWDDAAVNTQMLSNWATDAQIRPSVFGWLTVLNDVSVTFQGRTYQGFMTITSADGTKWWFLEIIPMDAGAINWQGSSGSGYACLTPDGSLFYHQVRSDNVVLVSGANNGGLTNFAKLLPVYPPISLPDPPPDTENPILPYRETGAAN